MNRTWIAVGTTVLVAGLALFLLWPSQRTTGPAGTPVLDGTGPSGPTMPTTASLNWMARWMGEHKRETFVRELAQEFGFLNPDLVLNFAFHQEAGLPNEKCVAAKIVEMIRSGNYEWDIVPVNTGQYRDVAALLDDPLWGQKYLVDFGEIDGFLATQKPCISEDPMYREAFGGTYVGPYIEGFYCMLWFNSEVARDLGLKIKQHGMTLEDLVGYVRAVHDYNATHGTSIAALYEAKDWRTTEYLFRHLFASAVGDYDELRQKTASEGKRASLLKTLQALEEIGRYQPLIGSYNDNVWFDTRGLVLDGQALFYVNGSWMYSHWMNLNETKTMKMVPAELPVLAPTDFYMGSYTPQFAVFKNAPNRDAAVRLLQFWCQPKVAEKWVRYTKAPTGLRGNLETSTAGTDQFEQFQARVNTTYGGRLYFSDDVGFILGEENKLLGHVVNEQVVRLLAGETTAQQAYDAVMAECK
ncbi:MAG: extracellular solute-binding protein [Verrucomicrobia bacterium]|nr:extracellular solute-binding protein [Verrucomicrobiota bacterium]